MTRYCRHAGDLRSTPLITIIVMNLRRLNEHVYFQAYYIITSPLESKL